MIKIGILSLLCINHNNRQEKQPMGSLTNIKRDILIYRIDLLYVEEQNASDSDVDLTSNLTSI